MWKPEDNKRNWMGEERAEIDGEKIHVFFTKLTFICESDMKVTIIYSLVHMYEFNVYANFIEINVCWPFDMTLSHTNTHKTWFISSQNSKPKNKSYMSKGVTVCYLSLSLSALNNSAIHLSERDLLNMIGWAKRE